MKKKKSLPRTLVNVLLLVGLLLLLFNPGLIPFIGDENRALISAALKTTFSYKADASGATLLVRLANVAAIVAVVLLCSTLIRFILSRIKPRYRRTETVLGLVQSVVKYAAALVMIVWVLSALGVNVTGIFASLGIISLIVGFGAQSLIEDIITGVFIIFEGQYNVGDIIVLDDFRGTVRRIGVRTTTIQDDGGNLKIVNNSDIRNVQNRSAELSVAVCDVGISYAADLEKVERAVADELPQLPQRYPELFKSVPIYRGVQNLGESAVILRVVAYVEEANYYAATRALNREMLLCFERHNIEIPLNQLVVHKGE